MHFKQKTVKIKKSIKRLIILNKRLILRPFYNDS